MNFILSFLAIVLFTLVYILDGIIILFFDVKQRKWYRLVSKRKFGKAFKVDVFANFLFPSTWKVLFSWNSGYSFGRFGETLSSCIGRKKLENTLSWLGLIFYYMLYAFDFSQWKNKGHCIASIMTDQEIEKFLNK